MGIDFGELTTGLGAILGAGRGIASNKHLGKAVSEITRNAEREFGKIVDTSDAAHVYEYGMEGNPAGRLWSINWLRRQGDMVGNIHFRTARRPTQIGAGIDERLASSAAAAGRSLAQHLFPDKAAHLESTKTLVSVAGVQKHTRRIGGDVPQPQSLVFVDERGDVKFRKVQRRENEFHNKFQAIFTAYWAGTLEGQGSKRVNTAFKKTMEYSMTQINRRVHAAGMMSKPRIPVGMSGVYVTDRGRPFGGHRIRQADVSRVEERVAERLRKELVSQWR